MSLIESAADVARGVTVGFSILILALSAATSGLSVTLDLAALLVLFNLYVFAYTDLTLKAQRAWSVVVATLLGVVLMGVLFALFLLRLGLWATAILAVLVTLGARWLVGEAARRSIARRGQREGAQA